MPGGMWSRQNSIGRPTITVSRPAARAAAAVASPYGPAPMTRTSI